MVIMCVCVCENFVLSKDYFLIEFMQKLPLNFYDLEDLIQKLLKQWNVSKHYAILLGNIKTSMHLQIIGGF